MSTTPKTPTPGERDEPDTAESAKNPEPAPDGEVGVQIGMSDGGSTFEPEEDENR